VAEKIIINCDNDLLDIQDKISSMYLEHRHLTITVTTGKQRSGQENKALHLWLGMLSRALNAAGYDMKRTLNKEVEIPWTTELAKEYLWRPLQKAMIGKSSTTEPLRGEYTKIYEVLNRHTASKLGISIPWPSKQKES